MPQATTPDRDWASAWLDAVAFVSVLTLAWWTRASASDLVWSLWLSSLVVGYAIILWAILCPTFELGVHAWQDRALVKQAAATTRPITMVVLAAVGVMGVLLALAFFTVHFAGFHYVHAGILSMFFPIGGVWDGSLSFRMHDTALFRELLQRYWRFLPVAFLAERAAFMAPRPKSLTMLPYKKVVRMHVLIFFFAFAHFAGLDNFAVYAVVYAAYFFPWRLLGRAPAATTTDLPIARVGPR